MKKKLLVLVLIVSMVAAALVGCRNKKETEEGKSEATEVQTASGPVLVTFDGYGYAWGMILCNEDDGEGNKMETEIVAIDMEAMPGDKISDVWTNNGYEFLGIEADGEVFEGWMEYKTNRTTDVEGYDSFKYERVSDKLYTTEELMAMEVPAYDVAYVAKWQSFATEEYDTEFEMMYAEEEVTEEPMGEEMPSDEAYLVLDANGGTMVYGADDPYETDLYTYVLESGGTLGGVMNSEWEDPMKSLEKDGKDFKGWKVYEGDFVEWPEEKVTDLKDGEECFDIGNEMYIRLKNCSVYGESLATEELGKISCDGKTYYAVAIWK